MKLSKKTIAVSTAALVITGGSAFAYLTQDGAGTGTGTVAAAETDKITLETTSLSDVVNNGPDGVEATITAKNSSTLRQYRVGSVALATVPITTSEASCAPSLFTATAPAMITGIPAKGVGYVAKASGTPSASGSREVATVTVKPANDEIPIPAACYSATITLHLTSSAS